MGVYKALITLLPRVVVAPTLKQNPHFFHPHTWISRTSKLTGKNEPHTGINNMQTNISIIIMGVEVFIYRHALVNISIFGYDTNDRQ